MLEILPNIVLCGVLLFCLYTDVMERRIYNKVILAAVIAGFLLSFLADGATGLTGAGKGFLLGAALLFIPFAAGGMGAGDLKLLAVIGLYQGTEFVFTVFLLAALLGGIFALALLLLRRMLLLTMKSILQSAWLLLGGIKTNLLLSPEGNAGKVSIPYAPFLVAATFLAYFTRQGG